jgi:pSer/pThr/pTyr-binding forkhead associated (FHA) protein
MNTRGYWPGTIAFWILLAVIAVYYACFFWGPIDNRKGKIIGSFGATNRLSPGIQEIRAGQYGRVWYLQGRTVTIGSGQEANISLNDPSGYLSRIHCSIRFNPSTGFYEVLDQSNSGTWVMNGGQLQPGVYSSVRRGSVLSLGSTAQQFRLL